MRSRLHTTDVAGVPIAISTLDQAVERLLADVGAAPRGVSVRFVNAFSVVSAHRDAAYLRLMQHEGVSYPDGAPVALVMRTIRHVSHARRVRGPSFFKVALRRSANTGVRHYFLGTTEETLQALTSSLERDQPDVAIAGAYAPPFAPITGEVLDAWASRVKATGANCIWVALGTPKQDFVAQELAQRLQVPCIAVGAAFDFLAGTKPEAPKWMQRVGIEWIFRLSTEPRRLGRRYVLGNFAFVGLVLRGVLTGR